jgi:hypothetical protein
MSSADTPSDCVAPDPGDRAMARLREAQAICAVEPEASFENVWHTLVLLDEPPVERLNRSLVRGRAIAVHQ